MKWLEIDQDNLHMKFSALNVNFSSPKSRPPRFKEADAGGRQRQLPHWKVDILPQLFRVAWKRLQIGAHMLLIITSTSDRLLRFINIDDLERPWTPKRGFLVKNFSQFLNALHIFTLNCNEMAEDRPRQPAYEIFNIKRRFRRSNSIFFSTRKPAHENKD